MKGVLPLLTKMIVQILKYFDSFKKKNKQKVVSISFEQEKDPERENWKPDNRDKLFLNNYDLSSYDRENPSSFSDSYKYL